MRLPRGWLRHRLVVEPYVGAAGDGPQYGPAQEVRCHLMPARRTVRTANGRTTGDATTAICEIGDRDVLTADARVSYGDRVVEVVSIKAQEWPGGPTPDHLEVTFV